MKNYFRIILFVLIELIYSNYNIYAQCTNNCGLNLIQNPGFETPSSLCGTTTDIQLYNSQSPVANWLGTDNFPGAGSSPDYFSPCAGTTNTANLPCLTGSGRVGIFTKTSGTLSREYVQSQLSSPLIAGKTYCYSMVVKSRVGSAGNLLSSCDGIGAWFHNQGLINIQTMNGGNQFLGPGSTINASPQVENPAGNLIGASCVTVTGTFCALGGESWIVIGNFRDDVNTTITGSNPANYMYIEDTQLFELCPPTLSISAAPLALNCGQSSTLTVTSTFPVGTSYTWVSPSGNTLSGIGNQVVTPSSNTTYSLVASYTNNCGVQIQTASVSITASGGTPVAPTFTPISSICYGASSPILPSSSNNTIPITGTWSPSTISNTASGIYTFNPTAGQCATTQTLAVTVATSPTLSVNNSTICPNGTATITATGASSYSWSAGLSSSTGSTVSATPISTTIYTVIGTVGSCTSSATSIITVFSPTISASSTTICFAGVATLTANGANTYTWHPGNTSGSSINVSPIINTTYTVNGTVGACTGSTTVNVNVTPIPTITVNNATVCAGQTAILNAQGASSYTWSNGSDNNSILVNPTATSIYTVIGAVNGCANTSTSSVLVNPSPLLTTSSDVTIIKGTSTTLSFSGNVTSFTWTPSTALSCTNCMSPVASPSQTTQYCVNATLGDCSSISCVLVTVEPACFSNADYGTPNAFTPNGDGINDEFCLKGWDECSTSFYIIIYNRWGEKVYESTDPAFCWDGTYLGNPLNSAVFVFYIKAEILKVGTITKKGNISLIK